MPDERQREVGTAQHLPVAGHEREEQQGEGDHDQPVGGLDEGAALESGVAHERSQRERQAPADRAQALRCGCAAHGHAGANSATGACENCDTDRRGDDDDDDTGDLHGTHRGGFPQVSEGKGGSAGRWPEAPRRVACAAHRWRSRQPTRGSVRSRGRGADRDAGAGDERAENKGCAEPKRGPAHLEGMVLSCRWRVVRRGSPGGGRCTTWRPGAARAHAPG